MKSGDGFIDFSEVEIDTIDGYTTVTIDISSSVIDDLVALREMIGGVEAMHGRDVTQGIRLTVRDDEISLGIFNKTSTNQKRIAEIARADAVAEEIADEMQAGFKK